MEITKADISKAVEEGAELATENMLLKLGIDSSQAKEMQADMIFIRRLRKDTEDMRGHVRRGLVGSLLMGLLVLLVVGGQEYFKK